MGILNHLKGIKFSKGNAKHFKNELSPTPTKNSEAYWAFVKRQFNKNKRAVFSLYLVGFMAFIALFADFIANEKPIYCKYNDKSYFPILIDYGVQLGIKKWPKDLQNINWIDTDFQKVVRPPIPYSATTQDIINAGFVSPFEKQDVPSVRWRHWLGTEALGRDVLSALIHGTRIAFAVGIVSMSIASLIGIILGALAGYFGDNRILISRATAIMLLPGIIFGWFYAFSTRSYILSDSLKVSGLKFLGNLLLSFVIFFGAIILSWLVGKLLQFIPWFKKKIAVPMDIIVQRLIEILVSIPRLFLVIAIVAIAKPSIFLVMVVIGLTSWTGIARFIRAELLKVRSLEYIEAAEALGYSRKRILLRHAIPNSLSSVLIAIAFGIASAILIESFLSFIGLGIPPETLSWGKLLSLARGGKSQLWVAIFPGMAIFITVTLFNLIGEGLTDAIDPKQKR
ncbi:MAG: ABC transporter permease [Chitinophagales bacterium]|nr:ABC transporter permease [Chitinophagales bacterium]